MNVHVIIKNHDKSWSKWEELRPWFCCILHEPELNESFFHIVLTVLRLWVKFFKITFSWESLLHVLNGVSPKTVPPLEITLTTTQELCQIKNGRTNYRAMSICRNNLYVNAKCDQSAKRVFVFFKLHVFWWREFPPFIFNSFKSQKYNNARLTTVEWFVKGNFFGIPSLYFKMLVYR